MWRLMFLFSLCTALTLTVYNNAYFEPTIIQSIISTIVQIDSRTNCACQCFSNAMCLTAMFLGRNKSCMLFFAKLEEGTLKMMPINEMASVLTFSNKALPGMCIISFL